MSNSCSQNGRQWECFQSAWVKDHKESLDADGRIILEDWSYRNKNGKAGSG